MGDNPQKEQDLQRLIRHLGKGVVGLNLKLDDLGDRLEHILAPAGRDRESSCRSIPDPLFVHLTEQIDGLDRVIERLERIAEGSLPFGAPRSPAGVDPPLFPFARLWRRLRKREPRADDAGQSAAREWMRSLQDTLDGLIVLRRKALDALAREGVFPLETEGVFDPKHHRVVSTVNGLGAGVIARVVSRGYRSGQGVADRVIRPALVVVGADRQTCDTSNGSYDRS